MVSHEFSNINLPVLLWVEGGGKRKEKKGRVGKDGGEVTEGRKGREKGREKGRKEVSAKMNHFVLLVTYSLDASLTDCYFDLRKKKQERYKNTRNRRCWIWVRGPKVNDWFGSPWRLNSCCNRLWRNYARFSAEKDTRRQPIN